MTRSRYRVRDAVRFGLAVISVALLNFAAYVMIREMVRGQMEVRP